MRRKVRFELTQATVFGRVTFPPKGRRIDRRSPLLFHRRGIPVPPHSRIWSVRIISKDRPLLSKRSTLPLSYELLYYVSGADSPFRTDHILITSEALYQMSYIGKYSPEGITPLLKRPPICGSRRFLECLRGLPGNFKSHASMFSNVPH